MILLLACVATEVHPENKATPQDCYTDADGDGYGTTPAACDTTSASQDGDCDDTEAQIHPDAPEVCNQNDDNCDTFADDDDPSLVDGMPFWVDEDGDGFGGTSIVTACSLKPGLTARDGDCNDEDALTYPGAAESCGEKDRNCDGSASSSLGSAATCPASSCAAILEVYPSAQDGPWWLLLSSGTVQPTWCDMHTDGGGWTLGFLRNTTATGSQGDFGKGEVSTEQLSVSPAEASSSNLPILAWTDLNDFPYAEFRLTAAARGVETWSSRGIQRSSLRISFGENGYYLYGEEGYYWCGGDATYTDGGIGAVNNPPDAPAGCRGHGSLGSGWDFSESPYANAGLTLCGGDGSFFLAANYGTDWIGYGAPGGAQAIWVR